MTNIRQNLPEGTVENRQNLSIDPGSEPKANED
jgi:hypothetical protein